MDLVSIIIPIYNVEEYIENCVIALCNQTYSDIEIILVDDGSTDNSGNIADALAEKDKRIKVIHQSNSGAGYARNTGLEAASGNYVSFVDSDDSVDSNLIELLVDGLKDGSDACVGGYKRINEKGEIIGVEKYKCQTYTDKNVYMGLFARMLGSSPDSHDAIKMAVWNSIFSLDIIKKHNIKFPSQEEYFSEDLYFNYEYFNYSCKASLIDSTAYGYRVTPESLTQKYKPHMLDSISDFYIKMENKISDNGMIMRMQRQFCVNIRCCMRQEHTDISGKSPKEIKDAIRTIVNHPVVSRVSNSYIKCIKQFKQKMFVFLVKNRSVNILYLFIKYKLL
ncbi:glycosyltransferase family 2 protein [Butyrivibrio sp. MC2021]|uniref:glycosyltransferase family 2 protein n=1 Tax=Butyrivibrio sp. MC2021 TaxID=1408306 RepID=UPI0006890509|nr:glycosyltransferase [Butyrivibrio sp. MC2021]